MKTIIILLLLVLSLSIKAQINLIKRFDNLTTVKTARISSSSLKYFVLSKYGNSITILNEDKTIYKKLYFGTTGLFTDIQGLNEFGDFYKNLYNVSSKICFWFSYSTKAGKYGLRIIDESGNNIQQFDSCDNAQVIQRNSGFEFITHNYYTNANNVYSLPGNPNLDTIKFTKTVYLYDTVTLSKTIYKEDTTVISIISKDIQVLKAPFPNPSSSFINIPYSIVSDGYINIYDSKGSLMKYASLKKGYNSIIIDVSKFTKGQCDYEVFNGGEKVGGGKFIVQ